MAKLLSSALLSTISSTLSLLVVISIFSIKLCSTVASSSPVTYVVVVVVEVQLYYVGKIQTWTFETRHLD